MIYHNEDINHSNKIDILPMIDIIFAILSFLIISSLYLKRVDTISIDLPRAVNSKPQDNKFLNLSINKSGDIFINKEKILLFNLKERVTNLLKDDINLIILNADKNISHGFVINVLDVVRSIDNIKIAISTKNID